MDVCGIDTVSLLCTFADAGYWAILAYRALLNEKFFLLADAGGIEQSSRVMRVAMQDVLFSDLMHECVSLIFTSFYISLQSIIPNSARLSMEEYMVMAIVSSV